MGTVDITDTHTDMDTMENALLMLNPRLMLSLIIMAGMDMDILDIVDTMDIHTDTDTMESVLLMLSQRLMLSLIIMADMDMDTLDTVDTTDTHMVDMPTTDKLKIPKPNPA